MLVDSVGRKGSLLALSLFWIGFPYLLMGLSERYWMLLACSALVGIGNNLWHPAAIPTLASRFPERKARPVSGHVSGLVKLLQNRGVALGPGVAGLLSDRYGIGATFWFVTATIVVANLLIVFFPKEN